MSLYRKPDELFPFEIRKVNSEEDSLIKADFPGNHRNMDFVKIGPQKWFLPIKYAKEADIYYNFEFRKDDVVIVTLPRSGTTLTQEMVWLLCNSLNYDKASEHSLNDRFPFLEMSILAHGDLQSNERHLTWKKIVNLKEKRFIKTHLPFTLLPPNLTKVGCKIIYVARNPKDVAISNYHLHRFFSVNDADDSGDALGYWNLFIRDLSMWCPYWEHVKEGWSKKDEENVLFMFYEDMIKDRKMTIKKVAAFLGISCTEEELETLSNHLNIDNFRKNKSVNMEHHRKDTQVNKEEQFIRKGKAGGWKEYFDEDTEKQANEWIEKNLKDTDLRLPI